MQAYEQIQSHAPSFAQITDPVFNELCVVQTDILVPNVIHYSEHPKISPVLLNTATTVLTPIDAQALLTKYANELKSLHHTLTKDLGFMSLIALVHTLYFMEAHAMGEQQAIDAVVAQTQARLHINQSFIGNRFINNPNSKNNEVPHVL